LLLMNTEKDTSGELKLDRLLGAVRRRLLVRRLAALTSRNLLIALLLAVPAAVVSAFQPSPFLPVAAAALCGLGLVIALLETAGRRPGRLDAALHIDRRYGLQERLSTLVSVPEGGAPPAVRAALVHDALARAHGIAAGAVCPVSLPRSAPFTGAALFCVAALLFGAAQHGSAQRVPLDDELAAMLSGSYVHIALPPGLREELDKVGEQPGDFDETLSRLDDLLDRFKALDDIKASLEEPAAEGLTAEDIERIIAESPDARARLKAALDRAAAELAAAEDLRQAARRALDALAGGSDEAIAEALEDLIEKLAAETAKHELADLKALKKLFEAAEGVADGGVTRAVQSGGGSDAETAPGAGLSLFPEEAIIKAKGAVRSGRVPARYRRLVERYFRSDRSDAGPSAPPRDF